MVQRHRLVYRRRVSHFVHAVLTVLTAGLWAPFWLASVLSRREDRVRLEVDRWAMCGRSRSLVIDPGNPMRVR